MAESDAFTVNEVVARNVYRLRHARGWTQAELAERLTRQLADTWDYTTVSKAEWKPRSRRRDRRRWSPDELVAVARVFQVPFFELFLVEEGMVDMGGVDVRGDDFFQLVFWIPAERRATLANVLYGGFDETADTEYGTQHAYQYAWFRDTTRALLESGTLSRVLLEAAADGDASALRAIQRAYMEALGPEVYTAVLGDSKFWDQMRQVGGDRFVDLIAGDMIGDDPREGNGS